MSKLLSKAIATVAIVLFWCMTTIGSTVATMLGTTIGATTLATAITAATITPAEARRRWRRRGRYRGGALSAGALQEGLVGSLNLLRLGWLSLPPGILVVGTSPQL